MKIQKETLTDQLLDEIIPLGQKSWDECSEIKGETCSFHGERGFVIQPDRGRLLEIESAGCMLAMTLRGDDGVLYGFSLCIYYKSLNHAPAQCANVHVFYIEPDHRTCIKRFISEIEKEFISRGVVVVGWPTTPSGKMFPILKLLGYAPDDVVMEKRLCALQPE